MEFGLSPDQENNFRAGCLLWLENAFRCRDVKARPEMGILDYLWSGPAKRWNLGVEDAAGFQAAVFE